MDERELERRALDLLEKVLDQPSNSRTDWLNAEAGDDIRLRDRVLLLLSHDSIAESELRTGGARPTADDAPPPDRIGAYRIEGILGRGGMGAVYQGIRDTGDFEHTVAIKVIRPGLLREELVERFERERQILADLNHPNIAKLMDGGTLHDDTPYIVMEYVDGVSMTKWAQQNDLSLHKRLALFEALCDAVRYAHQNLVVHRDLTPNNVLVTEDGVIKLIDFGIAKPHETDNQTGSKPSGSLSGLSFTAGYAAPERSKGANANTLSDIYSLGKILDDLLGDVEPEPDADLVAIISRASAYEPENRYASVDSLLEDLSAYKGGYSVAARDGGAWYRFQKYLRRRRLLVGLSTAAIAALIGMLGLTTVQYMQAEAARADAERRFNDVRTLANTMMFDIYDEIEDVPGTSSARTRLAEAAQLYLDDLSETSSDDASLKFDTAKGFIRLARISGSPTVGAQTNSDAAHANFDAAIELLREMLVSDPTSDEVRFELYQALYSRADSEMLTGGNPVTASTFLTEAIDTLLAGRTFEQLSLEFQTALLSTNSFMSVTYGRNNQPDEAITLAKQVAEQQIQMAELYSEDLTIQRQAAIGLNNVGRQLINMQRPEEAVAQYGAALEIVRNMLSAEPLSETYQRDLAYTFWRRAHGHVRAGEGEAALSDFNAAVTAMTELTDADPSNENHQEFREVMRGESMLAHKLLGDFETAEQVGLNYLASARAFSKAQPSNANRRRDVLIAKWNLSGLYADFERVEAECSMLRDMQRYSSEMQNDGVLPETDRAELEVLLTKLERCD